MNIKAAIFDMDGTLIDSLFYWESFWRAFGLKYFGKENFDYDKDVDLHVRTMIFPEALAHIRSHYGITDSIEALARFASDSLADFYEHEASVKAGVREFLAHLRREGVKLCLASATEMKYIKHALACHGLLEEFDLILSCADIGKGKDVPDIYLKALEELAVTAEEACVFEDSFVALETARGIGCKTVGIFDPNNYAQDRLERASDVYLAQGKGFETLIPLVTR